jgi:tetratricopeptide (TPR) repeat protein
VITLADSLDQAEHVIYDDTAALGQTIRRLDNPVGRLLMSNTLGKAHYYMGRNLSLSNHIAEAAEHYIAADRLQIDDPIYRGRVNSCMGYICAQNNSDSLALIFYERSKNAFKESGNEWYYAQSLLNVSLRTINVHQFNKADSLLQLAQSYQLDSAYQARYYEIKGLYFLEQQQYDSALVYFNQGLNFWQTQKDKCFSWLKMMQIYFHTNQMDNALFYSNLLISTSNNPNYLSNAYYCLLLDAQKQNDAERMSVYTHARSDAQKLLRNHTNQYATATPQLENYLHNPHPWRWVWITIISIAFICLLSIAGVLTYRQRTHVANVQIKALTTHVQDQEARLTQELVYRQFHEKLSDIVNKYHTPHKRWRQYSMLKRDINPWLHTWFQKLDTLPLSEQEKIFCTISLIYSHLTDVEIAEYMCYAKESIRIIKHRLLKKIGISNAEFSDFLHNLSIDG